MRWSSYRCTSLVSARVRHLSPLQQWSSRPLYTDHGLNMGACTAFRQGKAAGSGARMTATATVPQGGHQRDCCTPGPPAERNEGGAQANAKGGRASEQSRPGSARDQRAMHSGPPSRTTERSHARGAATRYHVPRHAPPHSWAAVGYAIPCVRPCPAAGHCPAPDPPGPPAAAVPPSSRSPGGSHHANRRKGAC